VKFRAVRKQTAKNSPEGGGYFLLHPVLRTETEHNNITMQKLCL